MIEASASASGSKPKSRDPAAEEAKPEIKEDGEGEAAGESDEVVPAAGPSRGGKNSGLRKVRLGAFEDTGRCKGYVSSLYYHLCGQAGSLMVQIRVFRFQISRRSDCSISASRKQVLPRS